MGDLLYGTIFSYLALNDVQDKLAALSAGIVQYRLPSFGIFSTSLSTQYWFGLPRNVSFSGLSMDVDHHTYQAVDKRGDRAAWVNYNQMTGARASAMEHLVPEQMFSTAGNPAQGISAVKALAIASAEGQRIWTIDQNNLNEALNAINLSPEIESEIRNAVLAGKVATAHEQPINFAGGANGGFIVALLITILAVLVSLALISGGFFVVGFALLIWELFNFSLWIDSINNASNATQFNQENAGQALVGALGLLIIPGIGAAAIATLLFGVGFSWVLVNSL